VSDTSTSGGTRRELLVGAFVFLALIGGLTVIILFGRERHVFEKRVALHTAFTDVAGLRTGAPVWLAGVSVGRVTRVWVGQPGSKLVQVDLEVSHSMLSRIRADSVASIGTQGLLGDKIVEISIGSLEAAPIAPGGRLSSIAPADLSRLLDQASRILTSTEQLAGKAAQAVEQLVTPEAIADFHGALKSVRSLLRAADQGHGLAHAVFYDPEAARSFRHLVTQLDASADKLSEGLASLDRILATTDDEGRKVVNNLSRAAGAVGALAAEAQRSRMVEHLGQASGDLAALTKHVRSGQGTLGAILVDPTIYEQLVTVLGGVERSRILRALVRYAIDRDKGRPAARVADQPKPAKPHLKATR
jgi:phospholipid/cholesterol/gamma-HCH transport system substrate-binding protein